MSKTRKTLLALLLLLAVFVVLPHGVVVPRFLWESRLQAIQSQYPNEQIEVKRVVLALSLNPQLMVSELAIHKPAQQAKVEVGLLRLGMNGLESIQQGRLQLQHITVKGLNVEDSTRADCSTPGTDCLPVWAASVVARAWQGTQLANPGFFTPAVELKMLDIEQANFLVKNPEMGQQLSGKIEQLKLELKPNQADSQFSLGWRVAFKSPQADNQMYVAMNGKPRLNPNAELLLNHLKVDVDGQWGGFPWTGTAEQDELRLGIKQANGGEGAPYLDVTGLNLRTYLRRDDLPETHQAAFSTQYLQGGLPAQNWQFKKAEWTFTHEDAQAWTFDLDYQSASRTVEIAPAFIQGSEGLPAEAQSLHLNCEAPAGQALPVATYWLWQAGWFRIQAAHPKGDASVVLCPGQ